MTTENNSASVAAPATTTATVTSPIVMGDDPNPTTDPVVVTNPTDPAPEPVVETPPEPDPTKTQDWAVRRINEVTAKRHEAERAAKVERDRANAAESRAAELLAQLAKPGTPDPNAQQKPVVSEEEIRKRVADEAMKIAAANRFNEACNDIVDTGKQEFKDWDEAIKNLGLVGAIGPDVSTEFLETAIELKEPHKILHYLGKNLEEAEKIAKMPPKKMAMEMARVEAQINAPKTVVAPPISSAPAPVVPVTGAAKGGTPSIDDPSLSMDDFVALRQKQADERRKRYQRA